MPSEEPVSAGRKRGRPHTGENVCIRLPEDLRVAIAKFAEEEGVTRAAATRLLLQRALKGDGQ